MENNITDSGGRVTRSLRKRIASVDSDNSSRPGTPVAPKLSSITEISASPSRSTRMSRRNSSSGIATPVKTSAKRATGASSVITESAEIFTPARRSTRRRSISTNEDEATPQSSLKVPSFPALSEEVLSIERNSSTAKKITRCQSKSPQQFNATSQTSSILNCSNKVAEDDVSMNNSYKRRKPGPKCKTRKVDEEDEASDVEISVVGKGIDEIKSKSSNITTIILTDDDSNQINNANMGIVKEQEENNTGGDSTVNITDMLDIADNSNSHELKDDAFIQKSNEDDNLNKFVGLEGLIENSCNKDEPDKQNEKHTKGENKFLSNASTLIESTNKEGVRLSEDGSQVSDSKKIDESMIAASETNCLVLKPDVEEKSKREVLNISTDNITIENKEQNATPNVEKAVSVSTRSFLSNEILPDQAAQLLKQQQQEKLSDNKIEIINICTLTTYNGVDDATDCKTSSKTVDFASNLGSDLNNKNVYPKTPVPTKTKFSHNDSIRGSHDVPEEHLSQVDTISSVAVNISETKTTPRGSKVQNLLKVQSSTPISVDTLNYASMPEIEKTLIKHDKAQSAECINIQVEKENLKDTAAAPADSVENETHLKWINPSVKGASMAGSKLDVMTFIENENVVQEISDIENEYTNRQKIEDGEDEELESVENEYEREDDFVNVDDEELTTEEKEHAREQNDFLDDEAKSIEDYESGDSMESEERKEIMDNEILVDGESIGSHTTDDENSERIEEEITEDSFIVSDNEDMQFSESSDENNQTDSNKDDDHHRNSRKKKKIYKRLQCPTESSSSDEEVRKCQLDDETDQTENNSVNHDNYKHSEKSSQLSNNANKEVIDKNQSEIKFGCNTYARQSDHLSLDSSKLSDSALRLHCSAESETEEQQKVGKESIRKKILSKLNHSDRFNKSVRDLNMEIEMSSAEDIQNRYTFDLIEVNNDTNKIQIIKADSVSNNNSENNMKEKLNYYDNKEGSHSVDMSMITESDDDKENEHETQSISDNKKLESGLSTSFDTYKSRNGKEKKERQHSFSVDMIPKSEGLHIRPSEISNEISILISPSPTNDQTLPNLKKEDVKYLENICHVPLPLGNPLVRTRRQSLALPTNPNMEICSPYGNEPNTKTKRKSLGILPDSDFNPSQSLIDTIELQKSYNDRQVFKRKHMSKSFCGASETLDNSVIDIDVQHLNKRSKIISEESIIESPDNTRKKVKADKLGTKTSPCQKGTRKDSKFNIQTILNRCDEILEAANQAKREAKTNCKKHNLKLSNKQRNRVLASSLETNQVDVLRRTSKDLNRKDKTKKAVTQAIKAAEKLLNKKHLENEITLKRLPSEVLETIEKLEPKKKLNKKATGNKEKKKPNHTTVTAIGNFVEIPQTPEKKVKEITYIQLPTGKVSVEPVTPKKRSVQACNGTKFRESPVTPHPIGFKVREVSSVENNTTIGEITRKVAKRKRYYDEHFKQNILPKPQWTQSGPFIEEEIPILHQVRNARKTHSRGLSQKSEKCSVGGEYSKEVALNFKQKAMMRSDIKRSTNREVMLLREHRQTQCRY